jgi:hypothetical protein
MGKSSEATTAYLKQRGERPETKYAGQREEV